MSSVDVMYLCVRGNKSGQSDVMYLCVRGRTVRCHVFVC